MKITDFARTLAIVLPCLAIGCVDSAFGGDCLQQTFAWDLWTNRDKNQFMYPSTSAHGNRQGFYCGDGGYDDSARCDNRVIILMPENHVWDGKGVRQQSAFYRCDTGRTTVLNGYSWKFLTNATSAISEIKSCETFTGYTRSDITGTANGKGIRYYCKKLRNSGVCVMSNFSKDICYATEAMETCLRATGGGTIWNVTTDRCDCKDSKKKWDENTKKCIKDRKTEAQECNDRKGYLDGAGACRCHDNEWFDPNQPNPLIPGGKGLCRPQSQCPSASGYTCTPGQVININNSNTFGDIGSNNPTVTEVGQEQTQGQTSENSNRNNNSSESNSSNTNNNNSNNGNTTVNGDNNNVNTGNGNGNGGGSSLQQCLASRSTANGKACCYLPLTGSRGAQYDDTTDTCKCNDGGKTFSIAANGHGQCTGGGNVKPDPYGPTPQCSDRMYYNATEKRCMCSAENQTEINNNTACKCAIAGATNDANGNCKCDDPKKVIVDGQCVYANTQCPNSNMQFNTSKGECECTGAYQRKVVKNGVETCECTVPGAKNDAYGVCKCNEEGKVVDANGKCSYDENAIVNIRAKITASYGKLNSTMGGFEKSVWKDAEGNFNTARLASDSIAGVVLGTAGGIITSKLVKKNQLKTGFEDIKCAIGGQNVASYGDSFSVGM